MARNLATQTNVTPPNSDYPSGRIKNDTGANDGTPVDEAVYGDIHQLMMKFLRAADITPNDQPENETNGFQLFQAFYDLAVRKPLAFNGWFPSEHTAVSVSGTLLNEGLAVDKDWIYITEQSASVGGTATVLRINRTNNAASTLAITNLQAPNTLYVDDTYVYLLISGVGLRVFDKTSGNVVTSKSINLTDTLKGLVIHEGKIYIGNNTAGRVEVYDQATLNPESPIASGATGIFSLEARYGRLYVADNTGTLRRVLTFDLATGAEKTAELIDSLSGVVMDVRVYGGRLYVLVENGSNRDILVFQTQIDGSGDRRQDITRSVATADDLADLEISQNQIIGWNPSAPELYLHQQRWEL